MIELSVIISIICFSASVYFFLEMRNARKKNIASQYLSDLEIEKTINYFSTSLFGQNSVNDILWDVAKNCISKLHFEDCVIYLFNNDRDKLVQQAAYGPKNPEEYKIYNPIEIPVGKGIAGSVAKSGIHEIIPDTSDDPRYIPDDKFRYSEIAVPIKFHGTVLGVIDAEHSDKNFFTSRHLHILTTIASLCANKIMKAKSDEALQAKEKAMLLLDKKLAESRLVAFRAQMNPHFIFNSMGTIQECILAGNTEDANEYLSKFSRLLRMVLENSELNSIPLEKEIHLLQLYLELESARFNDTFSYELKIDENIDVEEVMIPTMLIQPFAENAIWHGLLHKKDNRKLIVNFKSANDILLCEIIDNGIGRAKSAELKIHGWNHSSRAMKLINDKLNIISRHFQNTESSLIIEDLLDSEKLPAGTRVALRLPINLQPF